MALSPYRLPACWFAAAALLVTAAAGRVAAQPGSVDPSLIETLRVRNVGPANLGGRIHDIEVHPDHPSTIWVGHASGGVFKSVNNGTTWEAVFDDQVSISIGDIAIAPSNPSIVYVGTGEQNNRQSSSWGYGMYKTMDGGKTWLHLGLKDTHHIGRVQVHPADPDIVWVAAVGHLWGPNEERGVFMSTDGGATWRKTLYINENTGVIDLAVDWESPNILYAAAYQRQRTGFGFNGGGPHGGIYKSTDGGKTWRKLIRDLAEGDVGRIGLDICRSNTDVVYAIIESRTMREGRAGGVQRGGGQMMMQSQFAGGQRAESQTMQGVYRSDDKGETWTQQSTTNPRPMYYSQIRVDPNNDLKVWVLGTSMYYSEDAGITFRQDLARSAHVDHHAFWWDPNDSNRIILGNDGGLNWTYDGGLTWVDMQTIPWAQFYEISADNQEPFYNVMGGLQDNGTWYGPSGNYWRIGITNRDWMTINGGDGFYTKADPTDPNIVYAESQGGSLNRLDMSTMSRRSIRPSPPEGSGERYRFNWNSPIMISPHDPARIYFGGNKFFISDDRGDTWRSTEDLTKQIDRNELEIMGVVNSQIRISRNDGISNYGNITTISESPHTAGILWVGTDDGNLQLSRDGGETWTNVINRLDEVPPRTYVTRIEASRFAEGRAYVTFDGHRNNDFTPYVFVTENFGRRWKSIAGGIPEGSNANCIREHYRNPNLLFLGTERGAYWSIDRGETWNLFEGDLPRVPVDDIYIHPIKNDLIFGTHGRGAYVMDDIAPLEGMSSAVLSSPFTLFPIRYTHRFSRFNHLQDQGEFLFNTPNPPYGAIINYFLSEELGDEDEVEIRITDASGNFVRSMNGTKERGVNRVLWNLQHSIEGAEPAPTQQMRYGRGSQAPEAVPGTYTVTVTAAGISQAQTVEVRLDPRFEGKVSIADMIALRDVQLRIGELMAKLNASSRRLSSIQTQITELNQFLSARREVPEAVQQAIRNFTQEMRALNTELFGSGGGRFRGGGGAESVMGRLSAISREISGLTGPVPADIHDRINALVPEVEAAATRVEEFISTKVPELNRTLSGAGIPFLEPVESAPPPGVV